MRRLGSQAHKVLSAAFLVATAVATASPSHAAPAALISSVGAERHRQTLELHFKLRGAPPLHLSHHGSELWIDLDRTRLDIPPRPLFGAETAPLSLLRAIERDDGGARLVIETSERTDYAIARLPHELLIRLAPAGKAPDLAAPLLVRRSPADEDQSGGSASKLRGSNRAQLALSEARGAKRPSPSAPSPRVIGQARVVIDPGHGGRDPGTKDSSGALAEKDLAVEISLRLAAALRSRGVGVELTRDSDTFLTLAERTQLANRARADLFISVHLNSSPNPNSAGIEVYYLNNTTDRAALRLARMENRAAGNGYSAPGQPNLNYILSDLRQNYKAAESASLARMIEAQTVTELDEAFKLGVNPLGAKMGPFYVLAGAQMPAVLVECGFLSNRVEAQRLGSSAYQEQLADAIAVAVVHYLNADLAVGNL